jgi:hypothetical protein
MSTSIVIVSPASCPTAPHSLMLPTPSIEPVATRSPSTRADCGSNPSARYGSVKQLPSVSTSAVTVACAARESMSNV